jgi:hypothetical protein
VVLHAAAEGVNRSRSGMKSLLVVASLTLATVSAVAGQSTALCAAAKKQVEADPQLGVAVATAFGKTTFSGTGEDCVYPLKSLHYATADVLIAQPGEPGQACHGCEALLSAYVFRRLDGGLKLVRVYRKFAELGTFGAVGDISAVELGGDDGMAIESGGTFQGYSSTAVDFYAFRAGQLISLTNTPIIVAADNGGAQVDPTKTIEVTGKWSVDPTDKTALVVDYKIKANGAERAERVVWRLQGKSLVLSSGHVPPEVSEASGGG